MSHKQDLYITSRSNKSPWDIKNEKPKRKNLGIKAKRKKKKKKEKKENYKNDSKKTKTRKISRTRANCHFVNFMNFFDYHFSSLPILS